MANVIPRSYFIPAIERIVQFSIRTSLLDLHMIIKEKKKKQETGTREIGKMERHIFFFIFVRDGRKTRNSRYTVILQSDQRYITENKSINVIHNA